MTITGSMISLLREAESELPTLLQDAEGWRSLHIDYETPHVDRLWRQWRERFRINLHRIYPCGPQQAFHHPHPWPSAMVIKNGRYEMKLGSILPPVEGGPMQAVEVNLATVILLEGCYYEMPNRWATHSVRPLDGPVHSVMITGEPWDKEEGRPIIHGPSRDQRHLFPEERDSLFFVFKKMYPLPRSREV